MINAIDIIYESSQSIVAQGKNIQKAEKKGFYKAKGGNGSYRMVKPSEVTLRFEADGEIIAQSVKELIRDIYHLNKVTEKRALIFLDDVISGKIILNYSNGELEIA